MRIIPAAEAAKRYEKERADALANVSMADYDAALEAYLLETRTARGYTSREPSDYKDSSNPRWAQDALDWIDFRDRVMAYGLEVENAWAAGEAVPTLDEFKAHLRTIECHWTYDTAQAEAAEAAEAAQQAQAQTQEA